MVIKISLVMRAVKQRIKNNSRNLDSESIRTNCIGSKFLIINYQF